MTERKQLMTKKQFERMDDKGKYKDVKQEARGAINSAEPEDMLKLTLVSNSPTEVVDAFRIEDQQDRIKAFKK
ncbi:MAG: hypothetical protein ABEJ98_04445 [Candidatus Nanohaloarchaea archaeon]